MGLFRRGTDIESGAGDPSPADPQPRKAGRRLSGFAVRLLGVVGIGIMLPPLAGMGLGTGMLVGWLHDSPSIPEFEAYNPPEATVILDRDGKPLAQLFEQRRHVVPLADMPDDLPHAFVAIEDARFYDHVGVDPIGIFRAAVLNTVRGRAAQGGSTITQQTARNLLDSIGTEKTARRKIREMLVALQMEQHYTKDQILEVYLNQIYLGSGAYGVEAASRSYYGKHLQELTLAEAASLAGLPQLPERYSPLNNPEQSVRRRDQVLARMLEVGLVSPEAYDRAIIEPMTLNPERISRTRAAYFVDAVRRVVAETKQLEGGRLHTAGWKIRTTVDPAIQEMAEATLREGLELEERYWLVGRNERYNMLMSDPGFRAAPAQGQVRMGRVVLMFERSLVVELPGGWRADLPIPAATASYFGPDADLEIGDAVDVEVTGTVPGKPMFTGRLLPQQRLQGALVVMDAKTGEVRALVGGRDYNDRQNNGFFNRAVLARRQAGSTFKPLFFAAGIEQGMTPNSLLSDTPIVFGDGYAPRNYERQFFGPTTMQTALEKSRNIPTIRLVQRVGLRDSLNFVARFQRTPGQRWSLPLEWPVVLGTTGVTPLEVAAAYQPFANGGLARGPRLVLGAWNDQDREAVGLPEPQPEQLLATETAAWMVQLMTGVMTHGTGEKLLEQLPRDLHSRVAAKSGTTNENRDAWFAGFTPHHVIVLWVGFDQNVTLAPGRSGSRAAGEIWAAFAARLWESLPEEMRRQQLPLPEGMVLAALDPRDGTYRNPDEMDPKARLVLRVVKTWQLRAKPVEMPAESPLPEPGMPVENQDEGIYEEPPAQVPFVDEYVEVDEAGQTTEAQIYGQAR